MQVPTVQPTIPQPVYQPSYQPVQQSVTGQPVYQQPTTNTVQTTNGQTVDVNALVASLQAQGANQTQAYNAAMAQLQNAGVPATPAVQQQVATAVASPNQAGFSTIEILLLAAVALPLVIGALSGRKH